MLFVHKIADKTLEQTRLFPSWIDIDKLETGKEKDANISHGKNNAAIFIPFISADYCNSRPCREELALAKRK
jgi:hypothetical protein